VEGRFQQVDDVRLHAVAAGPGDGPLVVLLHGFPEFWFGWRHQIDPLAAAGYRVLAPDQRGYNLSDKPRRVKAYGLDRLAADVVGLIDAEGRDRAILVGHDWGAAVAWWVATCFPDRVERLAVLNVPHPSVMRRHLLRSAEQRRKSWYIFFFQVPWLPERWFLKNDCAVGVRSVCATARHGTFSDEEMRTYREAWRQPRALRGMIHWYRAMLRSPPRRPRDLRVRVPTLMIWGERDRFLGSEMIEPSLGLCDRGRVERLPEATHWLQHEEPATVNRLLLQFFAEPVADRGAAAPTPRRPLPGSPDD
jgi:pimeloyl-ACP methyl ester carboxylesterase